MNNKSMIAAAMCAGLISPLPANAEQVSDLSALRAQMIQMQKEYAARMAALEKRLAKAEAEAKAAKQSASVASTTAKSAAATAKATAVKLAAVPPLPAATPAATLATVPAASETAQIPTQDQTAAMVEPPAAPLPSAPPSSLNSFNPGIAAVLNGFYFAASRDPATARIAGIAAGSDIGLPSRGFSIGESEVSLTANIDPFMSGFLDVSFQNDNTPTVEEAYILSKDLPYGLTLKGGRFLSGVGYINERHAHDWLLSDAPLPYRAFLNNQYGDDGLQLRWLVPTDLFLEFGAEVFRGDAYPAAGSHNSGTGTFTAFVTAGNDFNESSSWLAKASYLHSDAVNRDSNGHLFSGITQLGILSGVYKWAPGGNPTVKNLTLTSELFFDRQAGFYDGVRLSQDRWGGYVQGLYQFMPRWSVGLRYAQLGTTPVPLALTASELDDLGHASRATTAMLEFDTSEFGRFRASYTHDEAGFKPIDELLLQYTVIYGPHGAHRY